MSDKKSYDIAVIGGGIAGYSAAIRAAQLGHSVSIIEKRDALGGTCLNVGCIPSKALLSSSHLFSSVNNDLDAHGIFVQSVQMDLKKMMSRKEEVVGQLTSGIASLVKKNGIDVFHGTAEIVDKSRIRVNKTDGAAEDLSCGKLVIATGSIPAELPGLGFDHDMVIDSTDALSLAEVPEKLVIIGAGVIGLEMASIWNRLGSSVRIIEIADTVLPGWDGQVTRTMKRLLEKQGITFHLSTTVKGYEKKGKSLSISCESGDGKTETFDASRLLVAAGRKPYCPADAVEKLQLKLDKKGFIIVDEEFRTSCDGVYALGDVIPGPMLAHKGEEEGVVLAENLSGTLSRVDYNVLPGVVYTFPEAAMAGKTEEQLKEAGVPCKKGMFQLRANGRALASGDSDGFVKVLSHEETDKLLGVHIVGAEAGLMITEAVTVMAFGGNAEDIGRTIHAHPTTSEAVREAALAAYDKALHGF